MAASIEIRYRDEYEPEPRHFTWAHLVMIPDVLAALRKYGVFDGEYTTHKFETQWRLPDDDGPLFLEIVGMAP